MASWCVYTYYQLVLTVTTNLLMVSPGWIVLWLNECLTVTTNLLTFSLGWMVMNEWMSYCDYQSTDVFSGVNGNEWMNVLLWLPIYWRFLWGELYWMNECLTVTTNLLTFSLGWMVMNEWMSYCDYQSTDDFSWVNGTVIEWMSSCDYQSTDVFSGVNGTEWMNVLLWLPIYWHFLWGEWYWMNECVTVTTNLLTFSLGWMVLNEWMSYCDYQSTNVFSGVDGTEWMNVLLWLPIY